MYVYVIIHIHVYIYIYTYIHIYMDLGIIALLCMCISTYAGLRYTPQCHSPCATAWHVYRCTPRRRCHLHALHVNMYMTMTECITHYTDVRTTTVWGGSDSRHQGHLKGPRRALGERVSRLVFTFLMLYVCVHSTFYIQTAWKNYAVKINLLWPWLCTPRRLCPSTCPTCSWAHTFSPKQHGASS
jgi:hypothetical protein